MEATHRRLPESAAGAPGPGFALALTVSLPRRTATQADFDDVETAITSAIASVTTAGPDFGDEANVFVRGLAAAKDAVATAATLDLAGDYRKAGLALRRAVRRVIGVGLRLRSLNAASPSQDGVRQSLLAHVQPIETSLRALRRAL